ncbi:MAG: hypothetical protein OHK93_008121 [Ramalina farinacea]|uniref:Uncharacterized protein n=1 Tax=Ramalina farinacea TaxID=258253 RepID=A0AA43QLU4_9LECA|nr:hypothetical protein [Ramalina farinacea]
MAEGAAYAQNRPVSIERKPTPGPNSWAQSQSQTGLAAAQQGKPRPTNRDKYENKPTPNLPSELENNIKSVKLPAIPILMPPDNPRTRAVTDPLDSSYALGGRKPSVTQLRKKFGHSKQISDSSTSNAPIPTGKAAEVLGIGPKRAQKAKVSTQAPEDLDNDSSIIIMQAERPLSEIAEPQQKRESASEDSDISREASGSPEERQQILGDRDVGDLAIGIAKKTPQDHTARLAPAKIGSYARIGKVGMLQGQGLVRIESVQGIIDHANPQYAKSEISERDSDKELDNEATPRSSSQSQYSAGLLKPISYSPNDYAGVWENDPAVVSVDVFHCIQR